MVLGKSLESFPGGSDGKVSACNARDPGSKKAESQRIEKESTCGEAMNMIG